MSEAPCRACGESVEVIPGVDGAYHRCRTCGAVGWDHPNRSLYAEKPDRIGGTAPVLVAPSAAPNHRPESAGGGYAKA